MERMKVDIILRNVTEKDIEFLTGFITALTDHEEKKR